MNLRTKAALYTLGFVGVSVAVSLIISWIASTVPTQYVFYGFLTLIGLGLIWMIYSLLLQRLEHFDKVENHIRDIDERIKKY